MVSVRAAPSEGADANRRVMEAMGTADPILVGAEPAGSVMPVFGDAEIVMLHAGPPMDCVDVMDVPPMRGAVLGGLLFEGHASDLENARRLLERGDVTLASAHEYGAVGPMAGVVTASMPVFVVKDQVHGRTAYVTINEGLGRALRFGAYGPDVLRRLSWMRDRFGPVLRDALSLHGPLRLRTLVTSALSRGDECHNRNKAATAQFFRVLAPALVRAAPSLDMAATCLEFITGNDHFFLNLSMAQSKATVMTAPTLRGSSVVTVMACNGTRFGVKVAGLPDEWFTTRAPRVTMGRWLGSYEPGDGAPLLGDSFISEVNGLGAFAAAAAPAITGYVGGTVQDLLKSTERMYGITLVEHPEFKLPFLDFRGSPFGIDAHAVTQHRISPVVNAGVASKEEGVGQIGAGMTDMPLEPFEEASAALAEQANSVGEGQP